jgi:UDP-glucuronate 4-epimerase
MYPMQQGDVLRTFADITDLFNDYGYKPSTKIKVGIENFINWFKTNSEKLKKLTKNKQC